MEKCFRCLPQGLFLRPPWLVFVFLCVVVAFPSLGHAAKRLQDEFRNHLRVLDPTPQVETPEPTETRKAEPTETLKAEPTETIKTEPSVEKDRPEPILEEEKREPVVPTNPPPKPLILPPKLDVSGHLQVDFRDIGNKSNPVDGIAGSTNRLFDIRRARLGASGLVSERFGYRISAEFADSVTLKDAYLHFTAYPWLGFIAGQFRVPFGNEDTGSSRFYDFLELSSISAALYRGRDRGAAFRTESLSGKAYFTAGLFDGTGSANPQNNYHFDYATQAAWRLVDTVNGWVQVWLGGSYARGRRDGGQQFNLVVAPETQSGQQYFSATFEGVNFINTSASGDATILLGPGSLKIEYLRGGFRFQREGMVQGGYTLASVFLTGEQRTLKRGMFYRQQVRRPVPLGWGAWELAVRYSWIKMGDAFFLPDGLYTGWPGLDVAQNSNYGKAWTYAVNWYLTERSRIMLNWVSTTVNAIDFSSDPQGTTVQFKFQNALLLRVQADF